MYSDLRGIFYRPRRLKSTQGTRLQCQPLKQTISLPHHCGCACLIIEQPHRYCASSSLTAQVYARCDFLQFSEGDRFENRFFSFAWYLDFRLVPVTVYFYRDLSKLTQHLALSLSELRFGSLAAASGLPRQFG